MKKRLGDLSSTEQEKVELEYHQMDPAEFDELMSQAKTCSTASIRLPGELVEPRGVRNTGDVGGEKTADNDVWV